MQHNQSRNGNGNGILIPILKKTVYEYSFLASNQSEVVIIDHAAALPVVPYFTAQLLVRVHVRRMSGDQKISVQAFNTLPSSEDPAEFTDDTATVLNVDVTATVPGRVPGLVTPVQTDDIGPYLKFQVLVAQITTAAAAELYAEISADLFLRTR